MIFMVVLVAGHLSMSSDAAVLQIGLGVESGQTGTDSPKVVL